jgi:predicted enzyme related to lactoylglutathione lyase
MVSAIAPRGGSAGVHKEEHMTSSQGQFVWYELMTTDTKAAKNFYGKVVGWGAQDMPMPGMTYTLLTKGDTQVGGLMDLPEDAKKMNTPPSWIGYVAVDDVDATAAKVKRLGGTVYVEPKDIPNIGRFAVVADPQKAAFALFKGTNPPPQSQPSDQSEPGRIGWHELLAQDWQKAFAFYSDLFGWKKAEAHDMGPMGTYQLFSAGGPAIGGMFNKPPEVPATFWTYYVNVDAIEPAVARVKSGGGEIINGPMEVPGGSWIVQCKDPQGAVFALVGKKN